MEENVCRYCIHEFRPSRYHPDQKVCKLTRLSTPPPHRLPSEKACSRCRLSRAMPRQSTKVAREKPPLYEALLGRPAIRRSSQYKTIPNVRTKPAPEIGKEQLGCRSSFAGCKHLACLYRWVL